MGWLCRVKGLYRFEFPQPVIDVTLQDRCSLPLIFRLPLAMNNQQRPQAQLCRLADKREDFFSRLLH